MRLSSVLLVVLLALITVAQAESAGAQSTTPNSTRKVLNKVTPEYPAMARTLNLVGTVRLEAVVQASGTVKSVQVKGGNPVLAKAAINAIHGFRWAKSDHDSIEVVEFHFEP
jgi:TonB family protein